MSRSTDLTRFYSLLDSLELRIGGKRKLTDFQKFHDWPRRGVYFFFESSEYCSGSGHIPRVVRVGTHALSAGSRSTLGQRLRNHRGSSSGGGNHRGSIFRLLVGQALQAKGELTTCQSWSVKNDAAKAAIALGIVPQALKAGEAQVEQAVTRYIGAMPFLWLDVDDNPGPDSLRTIVERNAIALLSNYERPSCDPASAGWLGQYSNRPLVRNSGMWNQRHVAEAHQSAFLDVFEKLVIGGATHK